MFQFIISLLIVAFGQPATSPWCALIAATAGYAIFWKLLLDISSGKKRFWLSAGWFGGVQLIQLFWFTSHPFLYIYAVYFFLAFGVGLQFGLVGLCITRDRLKSLPSLLAVAGLWTLLEWSRLFILAGYSLNPVGLALTANIYSLQMASLVGLYGLSFWVILVNLLALTRRPIWLVAALLPFLYGVAQIQIHAPFLRRVTTTTLF